MRSGSISPENGLVGWIVDRLLRNYWSLALCAVLLAIPAVIAVLAADRDVITEWLLANDLSPVATADTAKDFLGVATGINAAFLTLYFSITLIVLSLAAGNLGVRLIDRWLDKRLVRVSIAGLSFTLVFSLCAMLAVDAEADLADTPLGLVIAVGALQVVNVAMLAVALHDLGRTMFVDTSVAALANDARSVAMPVVAGAARESNSDSAGNWTVALRANCAGYVQGTDAARVARCLGSGSGRVRMVAAPGQHVFAGDALVLVEGGSDGDSIPRGAVPIGSHRSDAEGLVFQIRLLVEIAARAMSPAINDFYTAIVCADSIASAMAKHSDTWVSNEAWPAFAPEPRIELPGQDFAGLFEDPLAAFRQAACEYPSVSIRMIGNYAHVAGCAAGVSDPEGFRGFLAHHARLLADHAASRATHDHDRRAIEAAYEERARVWKSEGPATGEHG